MILFSFEGASFDLLSLSVGLGIGICSDGRSDLSFCERSRITLILLIISGFIAPRYLSYPFHYYYRQKFRKVAGYF